MRFILIVSCFLFCSCAGLEQWGEKKALTNRIPVTLPLEGCNYVFAREFTGKYCQECHTQNGSNPKKRKAILNLQMDTYRDWMDASRAVPSVLNLDSLEAPVMPPPQAANQPTVEERRAIVEWVKRGSPNTDSGR